MDSIKDGDFCHNFHQKGYIFTSSYSVVLEENSIQWIDPNGLKTIVESQELLEIDVANKSKEEVCLKIDYIIKQDDLLWRHGQFSAEAIMLEQKQTLWRKRLENQLKEIKSNRPKRLLVFINPNSGNGKSVAQFHNQVAPLFKLSSVQTDVVVTRDENHAATVLDTYDLSTIDGIISSGGDGSLYLIYNAYYHRVAKDHGIDIHDREADALRLPLPLGILSTGTYALITKRSTGVADLVTSTLQIMAGKSYQADTQIIHNGGDTYMSIFGSQLGAPAVMFDAMNYYRKWGRKMKWIPALTTLLWNFYDISMDVTVDILDDNGEFKSKDMKSKAVMFHNMIMIERGKGESFFEWMDGPMRIVTANCDVTRGDYLKTYGALSGYKDEFEGAPHLAMEDTTECKVHFKDDFSKHIIMVDGEIYNIKADELYVRKQKHAVKLFGEGHNRHTVSM